MRTGCSRSEIWVLQPSRCLPLTKKASEPQTACRQECRNVSDESYSSRAYMTASRTVIPFSKGDVKVVESGFLFPSTSGS